MSFKIHIPKLQVHFLTSLLQVNSSRRRIILSFVLVIVAIIAVEIFYHPISALISAKNSDELIVSHKSLLPKHTGRLGSRLSLFPEANRMRRRLGKRFIYIGSEVSTLIGTLSYNGKQQLIQVTRRQDSDTERVQIRVDDAVLTWDGKNGPVANGEPASGMYREIIERVALDSPDHFILAQLDKASYQTIAKQVRPAEAGASDKYNGPLWDVVQMIEITGSQKETQQEVWRQYYLNSSTQLIDKILSNDNKDIIVAELSNWSRIQDELVPIKYVWRRNGNIFMEITYNTVGHSAKL